MRQDAPRCPSCSAPLTGQDVCPACGLPLTGPAAAALWRIDTELAAMDRHRARLLADREAYLGALRDAQSRGAEVPQRPLPYDLPLPPGVGPVGPAASSAGSGPPGSPAAGAGSSGGAGPRKDLAGRTAQNLMLALGGLLLVVAAIVFTVVTWGSMGIGGRAAILLGITAVLGYLPHPLRRRGLTATGETLAVLAVALLLLDCYAARDLGLAGLDRYDAQAYWAVVTAVTAVLCGAYARVLGLGGAFAAGVLLTRFPLPLAAAAADLDTRGVAAGLILTAALDLLLLRRGALRALTGRSPTRPDRAVTTLAFLASWVAGGFTAVVSGPVTDTDIRVGAALVAATAAIGAAFAIVTGTGTAWRARAARTVAVGAALAAILAPVLAVEPWLRSGLDALVAAGVVTLALLAAAVRLPVALRFGAHWAGTVVVLVGLLWGLPTMLLALFGPLLRLGEAWQGAPGAAQAAVPYLPEWSDPWTFHAIALYAIGGVAAWLASRTTGWRGLRYVAAGLGVLAVVPVPFVGRWPYGAALAVELALFLGLLGVAAFTRGRGAGWALLGAYALTPAPILLALADRTATLSTLAVIAAASAAVAALPIREAVPGGPRPASASPEGEAVGAGRPSAGVSPEAEAAPEGASAGPPVSEGLPAWPPVGAGPHAGVPDGVGVGVSVRDRVRMVAAVGAVFALAGEAFAVGRAAGLSVELSGLIVIGVAALTVPLAWPAGRWAPLVPAWETAGAVTAAAGLLLAAGDPDMLDLGLAATGVLLLATALRPGRDRVWYAGAGFLLVAAWLRLWLEDVEVIEAYSLPFAIPALVIGWLRRRRRPELSSWAAFGTGLAGGLVPSLLVVIGDEGWARPLLLGAAALVIAVAGARARLQAPALLGAAALAIVVIRELAPEVARVLEAVPRWVPISLGGALLLFLGATFERRMRDLRALRGAIGRMD